MLRIGNDVGKPQGSKVGVFIYCQEHAREWGTPLVCLETAERLLRNYATDPETKSLVDGLDIFIVPTINADGAAYSMYDFNSQRKNMVNYCASNPTGNNDPYARNTWGVDLNRNFSVGSGFDGYVGARHQLHRRDVPGPARSSPSPRPATRQYVQSTYTNIKFAMNVHSSGGYFMWPPGAYTPVAHDAALPAVRHAELLRPDRLGGPGPDLQLPQDGDPAAADRPRGRRALLGRRQLGG